MIRNSDLTRMRNEINRVALTQTKIGYKVNLCQPSIQKVIMGNFDYHYNKFHGGIITKVGKHLRLRNIPYCCNLVDTHGKTLSFVFRKNKVASTTEL